MSTTATAVHSADGVEAGRLGIWLFLLSEMLLFGGFLASYVMLRWGNETCRLGIVAWPREGYGAGLALATLNTLVLITSSLTMAQGVVAARRRDAAGARANLGWTIVLGAAFLVIKGCEYALKIHHGLAPGGPLVQANPGYGVFVSSYFTLTGLHGLHVIAGLVWLGTLRAWGPSDPEGMARRAEYAGLYWHFVDVVWVFLFPLFYLI